MDILGQIILEYIICIDKLLDISSFSNNGIGKAKAREYKKSVL